MISSFSTVLLRTSRKEINSMSFLHGHKAVRFNFTQAYQEIDVCVPLTISPPKTILDIVVEEHPPSSSCITKIGLFYSFEFYRLFLYLEH
jgi:hypothetical protein